MLQPVRTLSLKYTLRIKDKCKIKNPRLSAMKVICNTKGAALFLPFLLGGHCDSTDPFRYHLQVNDTYHIPGTSNAYYDPFHEYLAASKYYLGISTAASQNTNISPSFSS